MSEVMGRTANVYTASPWSISRRAPPQADQSQDSSSQQPSPVVPGYRTLNDQKLAFSATPAQRLVPRSPTLAAAVAPPLHSPSSKFSVVHKTRPEAPISVANVVGSALQRQAEAVVVDQPISIASDTVDPLSESLQGLISQIAAFVARPRPRLDISLEVNLPPREFVQLHQLYARGHFPEWESLKSVLTHSSVEPILIYNTIA